VTATVTGLNPLECGRLTLPLAFFLDGEPGSVTVPVATYLIEHPDGYALFDAGLGPRFRRPTGAPANGFVDLEASSCVDVRLRSVGVDPADVRYLVNSHLHTDHAGGNALVPAATVVVQRAEWEYAHRTGGREYELSEFDTGQAVRQVEGRHDLFGDSSVVLIPTPGHTPGHQSALVQTTTGEVVLTGDACNMRRAMDELRLPDHAHDLGEYERSLLLLRDLRTRGAVVLFGHDPEFWNTIPHDLDVVHPR
jgi:N-acyl homoserine lactone hydrolase